MADDLPAALGGPATFPDGAPTWPPAWPAVAEALAAVVRDGSWGRYHGPHAERLCEALSRRFGVSHIELCCSGTAAVELALRGLGVGAGDEVVLAGYDFKGNFADVAAVGAQPVLADIDPDTGGLDPDRLADAFGPTTKAVIASHLHGGVADLPRIMELARARGVAVIEDACQMPGATVFGRPAGTWGDVGVLSFGGSKLLSAGRGGAVLTNRADIAQRLRLYARRGNDAYPLSELQAAVLLPQLANLDELEARRRQAALRLTERLSPFRGLRAFRSDPANAPGYYKLGFWYEASEFCGLDRAQFVVALRAEGVAIDAGFRALHRTHLRRRFRAADGLEHSARADEAVLVLHHPVLLEGPEALDRVAAAVGKAHAHAAALRGALADG